MATPRRLVHAGGEWFLEVERLVHLGEGVLRPTREQVQGAAAILGWLETSPEAVPLAHAASTLFHAQRAANDVAYEPAGDVWVQSVKTERLAAAPPTDELAALRDRVEILEARLAELEARLT